MSDVFFFVISFMFWYNILTLGNKHWLWKGLFLFKTFQGLKTFDSYVAGVCQVLCYVEGVWQVLCYVTGVWQVLCYVAGVWQVLYRCSVSSKIHFTFDNQILSNCILCLSWSTNKSLSAHKNLFPMGTSHQLSFVFEPIKAIVT